MPPDKYLIGQCNPDKSVVLELLITEGGNTSRTNISARFNKQWKSNWKTTDHLFYSRYQFNLYSNLTFFLDDPISGDMINQREKEIYGDIPPRLHVPFKN